jgi:hypothetical protein
VKCIAKLERATLKQRTRRGRETKGIKYKLKIQKEKLIGRLLSKQKYKEMLNRRTKFIKLKKKLKQYRKDEVKVRMKPFL